MNDQAILDLLKNKDYRTAGKVLYRYYPVVKKFILKNSGTRQQAEDIFQDALLILIGKVDESHFKLTSSLNTYIFGICKTLWKAELRKSFRFRQLDHEPVQDETLVDLSENEQQLRLAQKAIENLGKVCKELLSFFYLEKKSFREIAAKLKFSSELVAKNQKYRCLEKARNYYTDSTINLK